MFNNSAECNDFHHQLNNLHERLKFTKEEKSDSLPFLDVLVERTANGILTSVYRKPTFSGEYVRWSSFCDKRRKINIIKTLLHRARSICSQEKLQQELSNIKSLLIKNGYPENTIHAVFKESSESVISTTVPDEPTKIKDHVYIRLPYIGSISSVYRKRLQDAVKKCYTDVSLRTIFTSKPILPNAKKDVLPTLQRSNVIYQFTCHCGSRYVGRTSQRLSARIAQHVPPYLEKIIGTAKARSAAPTSAIGQHVRDNDECGKNYSTDKFEIVSFGRTKTHLSILESMYISERKPILCKQKEFVYTRQLFK